MTYKKLSLIALIAGGATGIAVGVTLVLAFPATLNTIGGTWGVTGISIMPAIAFPAIGVASKIALQKISSLLEPSNTNPSEIMATSSMTEIKISNTQNSPEPQAPIQLRETLKPSTVITLVTDPIYDDFQIPELSENRQSNEQTPDFLPGEVENNVLSSSTTENPHAILVKKNDKNNQKS
jgi:hypothetical protein